MAKNNQSTKKPVYIGDNADLCATAELVHNGGPIDWRYWSARREITPQEAAKLAHCIDPIQWPDDQHAQGPILNDLHIKIQRLAALLAERNQKWTLIDLAAMLGNNAPLFMREIANLAQQAADRCNTGIQASKAPPPITRLGNTPFKLPQFDTNVKGLPNWKHWRHVSTVEIWQGLLLSLNIEPPGNGWLIDNAVGGTGDIPYEYLDSHGLTDEFIRRWKLVCNRLETLYASTGAPQKAELTNFLRLPLFAAWAVEFEWDELPPELVALAQSTDKQTDVPAAGNVEEPVIRMNENRAFLQACIKDGIAPDIESIWLHIRAKAGTNAFLFKTAGQSSATTVDDRRVEKKNLGRVLSEFLATTKNGQGTDKVQIRHK
ncbi:MAG: hypothetical protein ACYC2E_11075 [Sulfuricella sp.]